MITKPMSNMKKAFAFILIYGMILTTGNPVSAKSTSDKVSKEELEQLFNQYGYEIVQVDETQDSKSFDSMDEIEAYLNKIDKLVESNSKYESSIDVSSTQGLTKALKKVAVYTDNHLFNWYNPFAGFDGITILCWNNVYMGYSYSFVNNAPRFVSVDSVSSYLSGISLTWWDQNGYSASFSTQSTYRDKLTLTVDGCYVLGVEISGFTIGARRNSSWECSLTLC